MLYNKFNPIICFLPHFPDLEETLKMHIETNKNIYNFKLLVADTKMANNKSCQKGRLIHSKNS